MTTRGLEEKWKRWNKISSLVSSVSILGRFVTAGFIMAGVSSWLCSYYCFNQDLKSKPADSNHSILSDQRESTDNHQRKGGIERLHEIALKSSVLFFSISTYYCIGLFSTMEIQEIDIPDIDFKLMEISPRKFVITGSILASVMSIPTSLMLVDWIKECYALYEERSEIM